MTSTPASPPTQAATSMRLDADGIPILDEVLKPPPSSAQDELDARIQALARSIAAEAAVEFARELEIRLLKTLAPLLEQQLKQLSRAEGKDRPGNEDPPAAAPVDPPQEPGNG